MELRILTTDAEREVLKKALAGHRDRLVSVASLRRYKNQKGQLAEAEAADSLLTKLLEQGA